MLGRVHSIGSMYGIFLESHILEDLTTIKWFRSTPKNHVRRVLGMRMGLEPSILFSRRGSDSFGNA